uniref:K+ potassium transporter C-terminal domain-containing protein n=1 Tax=Quercus lobata TaxID=97700 RepID=A0A7N2LW84_QUELO
MIGVALLYTELVHGNSPIFIHYVANVLPLHSVLVFVSIKYPTISIVAPEERFLFERIEHYELGIFRCIVRYGYKDSRFEWEFFKEMLVNQLKEFIRNDVLKLDELDDNNKVEKIDEEMIQADEVFMIPRRRLLKVGMTYKCISGSVRDAYDQNQTIQVKIVDYLGGIPSPPSAFNTTTVLSNTTFGSITNLATSSLSINIEYQP